MQNLDTAVFIGRFQPFHNGHLSVLLDIQKNIRIQKIIILIGSSQFKKKKKNPYSYSERKKIIKCSISGKMRKKVSIYPCPDVFNDKLWYKKIIKKTGKKIIVYSGNKWVQKIFIRNNIKVISIKKKINISGTKLRYLIKKKDPTWQQYVSKKVSKNITNEQKSFN